MENLRLLIDTIAKSHAIGILELSFLFKIKNEEDSYIFVCLNHDSIEIKDDKDNIAIGIDRLYPDFSGLVIDTLQNGKGRGLYDKLEDSPQINVPMSEFAQGLISQVARGSYVSLLNADVIDFIRSYTFRRGANIVIDTIYESLRLGIPFPTITLFRADDENIIIKPSRLLEIIHWKSVELEYTIGRDDIVTYLMEHHHSIDLVDKETSRAYLLEKIENEIARWASYPEVSRETKDLKVIAYTYLKHYVKRYH